MLTLKQKLETLLDIQQQIDELERKKFDRLAEYNTPVIKRIEKTLATLIGKNGAIDLSDADITVESGDIDSLDADGYRGGEIEYHADELYVEDESQRVVISWWHSLGAYGDNGDRHTSYLSETDHWVIRDLMRIISDEYGVSFKGAEQALIDDDDLQYYRDRLLEMATSLVIPSTEREIGYRQYANLPLLEEVRIPDGVTTIGEEAFADCHALRVIHLPVSVTRISHGAFRKCGGLTVIHLPDTLEEIGDGAFIDCTSLAEIDLPDGLIKIGGHAFEGCTGLTAIHIPESVEEIGDSAFVGCSGLTEILVPDRLAYCSFAGCSGLKQIHIPEDVTEIGRASFEGCSSLTEILIPEGVTAIGSSAFEGCSLLKRVSIPKGVTRIERSTFRGCSSLTEVLIPEGVSVIGEEAFAGCKSLKEIHFPDSLTEIGNNAFIGCSSIASIHIPDKVKEIGFQAFSGCSGISTLSVSSGNGKYRSPNQSQAIMAGNELVVGCKTTTVPEGTEEISATGGWSGLTEVFIPDSVCKISWRAFSGCQELKRISIPRGLSLSGAGLPKDVEIMERVTIPGSETEIKDGAFSRCTAIREIRIHDGITRIGREAFFGCTGLTEIHIPGSVTEIGEGAFVGCNNIKAITVSPENTTFDSRDACNGIVDTASNVLILGCENTVIPESVVAIGDGAFIGCGPEEISIPGSVTRIGREAFCDCTGLSRVFIPDSVVEVGENAFLGCCNLVSLSAPEGLDLKAAKVPRRRGYSIIARYSPKRELQTLKSIAIEMPGGESIPVDYSKFVDDRIVITNWPVILETASDLTKDEIEDAIKGYSYGNLSFFVLSVLDVLKGMYGRLPDVLSGLDLITDSRLRDELIGLMTPILELMTEHERKVLELYYGIGCTRMTLAAIGVKLGYTVERVRQMKEKAYRKVKTYCPFVGNPEDLKRLREERSEEARRRIGMRHEERMKWLEEKQLGRESQKD